jgi:NAD(P)-dependent dehydrogenase (short-subunit alcohol dehydrogenase family)
VSRVSLAGRRVLLTGAAGGLGRALASAFAAAGCPLFLTSRSADRLGGLCAELSAAAGTTVPVVGFAADLRVPREVAAVAERAESELGGVDILVNNAGVFHAKPLLECGPAEYEELFEVNVRAPFLLARALVPGMARQQWGRVLNIGSSSSYAGYPDTALYCASKHALLGLSRAMFAEFKELNVRTICLSPGSIKSPMGARVPGQRYEDFLEPDGVADHALYSLSLDGALVSEEVRLNRMSRQ